MEKRNQASRQEQRYRHALQWAGAKGGRREGGLREELRGSSKTVLSRRERGVAEVNW